MQPYQAEVEQAMKRYYVTLTEKDQRLYAAVEALKLGRGGQRYIAELLGCSEKTVSRGLEDLAGLPEQPKPERLQCKPGGGRNRYDETHPNIDTQFKEVLKEHTAGDPMNDQIVWTDLTPREIGEMLEKDHEVRVSKSVVVKLLKKHNYRRRKAQKKETLKSVPHRDEQFAKIAALKAEFRAAGNPIISFDTKKKEYLGNLYREGHLYTKQEQRTYDHDFTSYAEGIIIPHGIYDVQRNIGYLHFRHFQRHQRVCLRLHPFMVE
jgi:hypothetical protein